MGHQKLNLGRDGNVCPAVNMNTLSLINPLVFVFGVVISFIFRNNMFIHIERETRERKKVMEILDAKIRKLRGDFEEAVDSSEEAVSQAEDDLKDQEDADANAREEASERLAILQTNIEEMKDVIGRMNADYVSERDHRRAIEGFFTYERLREILTPFVLRSEVENFVTAEKAANMVFQSEAIQRRRLELVRKALEALTLHAEQKETDTVTHADLANCVARGELVTYVGREELVAYATRSDLASLPKKEELASLTTSLAAIQEKVASLAAPLVATPLVAAPLVATPLVATPLVATPLVATPSAEMEADYYQGWMAAAEMNGIKAEVEICNIQLHTKAENKAWFDEEGIISAALNRDLWLDSYRDDYAPWKQDSTNPNEYIYRAYKSGEWSTGVKTEMKLTFPVPPPPPAGLPPPPPRNNQVCGEVFTKFIPLLAWERVLLAADSM